MYRLIYLCCILLSLSSCTSEPITIKYDSIIEARLHKVVYLNQSYYSFQQIMSPGFWSKDNKYGGWTIYYKDAYVDFCGGTSWDDMLLVVITDRLTVYPYISLQLAFSDNAISRYMGEAVFYDRVVHPDSIKYKQFDHYFGYIGYYKSDSIIMANSELYQVFISGKSLF